MAKIYHLNCPSCGGILNSRAERVVNCRYCGQRNLVLIPDWIPSYFIKPKLDLTDARRAMVKLFKDEEVEQGLLKNARFESAELFFVPIYQIVGRRVGTFLSTKQTEASWTTKTQTRTVGLTTITTTQLVKQPEMEPDTKVILSDMVRGIPAVELEDWGIDRLNPETVIFNHKTILEIYQRDKLERLGTVLEPRFSPNERLEWLYKAGGLTERDNTEIIDQRISLIYYPVFRVGWRYQGRAYKTTIDGITGDILFARAPFQQKGRLLWLLLISSATGFSLGKILTFFKLLILTGVLGLWFILIFAFFLLLFVGFGWNMVRYSAELVIEGENRSLVWLGRPKATVFDKMLEKVNQLFQEMVEQNKRKRAYWS